MLGLQAFTQTPHQQSHVSALTPPIGVQFVENQKLQTVAMLDDAAVVLIKTGEDEFQHHEVGEENVGRVVRYVLAFGRGFLSCVTGDGEGLLVGGIAVQEFVEFFQLAVGQRVHGIDDDGAGARRRVFLFRLLLLQYPVDDRDEEGEGFAGAGARRDHVALSLLAFGQRLFLMGIELERQRSSLRFTYLENIGAVPVQKTFFDQFLDGMPALIVGVDLDERVRPVATLVIFTLHRFADVCGGNARKAARKGTVFLYELFAKIEDVFHRLPLFVACPDSGMEKDCNARSHSLRPFHDHIPSGTPLCWTVRGRTAGCQPPLDRWWMTNRMAE